MHVLLAEDNRSLARATSAILSKNGFDVDVAHDGSEALKKLEEGLYDVAVLDIMMPVMDGLEVLQRARAAGNDVPVIMLTAKTQVDDRVRGLDLGANDYMTKPFDSRELVARIKAAARPRGGAATTVSFDDVLIETERSELSSERGGTLKVDPHEAHMAAVLARAAGRRVSTQWLADHVWEGEALDGTVALYASFINGKLQALGSRVSVEGDDKHGWKMVSTHGATA